MSNYPQENIKPYNQDESKAAQVEKMFDNIAPTYDNLNHVLSLGIDKSWRRKAINMLKPYLFIVVKNFKLFSRKVQSTNT